MKEHMMAIHLSHPYYGCPRMKVALQEEGMYLNHKRVYRLMKNLGIQSVIRKKRRYFGQSGSVLFPNR
ncbi:IS3 family transposase, partial [Domibacillus sp. 8LH]|uniref:IS3 family transposase n=1 Tax=Domibacillus sp. 8LH TaxID=3073900 RepID=UPI00317F2670